MVIDFQQHYTPPELLKGDRKAVSVQLDENGNPNYLLNPLLADLDAHVRMMDRAGIDAGVLSCGVRFRSAGSRHLPPDQRPHASQAVDDHPGRFIGLAHVPALKPAEATAELKRCAVELAFPAWSSARSCRARRSTPRRCGRSGARLPISGSTCSSIRCRR